MMFPTVQVGVKLQSRVASRVHVQSYETNACIDVFATNGNNVLNAYAPSAPPATASDNESPVHAVTLLYPRPTLQ